MCTPTCCHNTQCISQDYAECDSEDPGEEAEEVTTTNDCPDEEDCEENSPPWEAGKTDFSNTKADNDEEESESEDDVDGSCDADDGNADDGSGGGGEGCIEEEEDSAMLGESCSSPGFFGLGFRPRRWGPTTSIPLCPEI